MFRRDPKVPSSSRTTSHEVCRPFSAPSSENPCPGVAVQTACCQAALPSAPRRGLLHPRGPPSPCLTTLTACASPCPVECFVHSRSWGSVPLLPIHMNTGGGWMHRGVASRSSSRSVRSGPGSLRCRHRSASVPSLPSRRPAAPSVRRGPRTLPSRRSGSGSPLARSCCRCLDEPGDRVSSRRPRHPSGYGPRQFPGGSRVRPRPVRLSTTRSVTTSGSAPPRSVAQPPKGLVVSPRRSLPASRTRIQL